MGHVIEHVALELQSLTSMEYGFGNKKHWQIKKANTMWCSIIWKKDPGVYAARASVRICQGLGRCRYLLEEDIQRLPRDPETPGLVLFNRMYC